MDYDMLTYIGRMQLLHNGQLSVIRDALTKAQHLLVLVGSSNRSRSIRNPFSFAERKDLLQSVLQAEGLDDRVTIKPLPDVLYGNGWFDNVMDAIQHTRLELRPVGTRIGITGHDKDATSYYLKRFPQLKFEPQPLYAGLHSTDMRASLFRHGDLPQSGAHPVVSDWAEEWAKTAEYARLREEFFFVEDYRKTWPDRIYNTADAVVTCQDKVLVIRRGRCPGKGQIAFPGGFIESGERFLDAAIRELREETCLEVTARACVDSGLFDDPERDVRRHIVSQVYRFDLGDQDLPAVQARDDADEAFWMTIEELMAQPCEVFGDHWFIARRFLAKNYSSGQRLAA